MLEKTKTFVKSQSKRFLAAFMSLVLVFAVGVVGLASLLIPKAATVTTWAQVVSAALSGGTITVNNTISCTSSVVIPKGKTLNISGSGKIVSTKNTSIIQVNGVLNTSGVTYDGGNFSRAQDFCLCAWGGGTINFNSGVVQNVKSTAAISCAGTVNIKGGTINCGGTRQGVVQYANGKLNISGGTITGNGSTGINNNGCVTVCASANCNISGGTITNNKTDQDSCAAVAVIGSGSTLAITGGTISNSARGIYVCSGSSATIKGGTISGNSSSTKGAAIYNNGTVSISSSTISGNKAVYGGAIFNDGTKLTISGTTKIQSNTATASGGAIYNKTSMSMSAGTISSNTATTYGGGIINKTTLSISGGSITGNKTTTNSGGGIQNDGTLTMTGGSITSNTAKQTGGGINNGKTITMSAGSITGNTSTGNGAGIYQTATLNVKGSPTINSNSSATSTSSTNGKGNVYLPTGKYITVTGDLTGGKIGVTAQDMSYTHTSRQVLNGSATTTASDTQYKAFPTAATGAKTAGSAIVFSDNSSYYTAIGYDGNNAATSGSLYYDYQVAYNGNGATAGTMANTAHATDVSQTLRSNAYSKTGYTFKGWNTKADGTGTAYANAAAVKNLTTTRGATVTIYAQWTKNSYQVAFNGNSATSGAMSNQSFTYDVAQNLTSNAYGKPGYTFGGWNTKADGTGTAYTNAQSVTNLATSGTVNLYAQWTPINYQVAYNANGGTGTMANSTHQYDVAKNLTANAFTRAATATARYTFVGWNTKADGTGTTYSNQQAVTNLTTTNGATVTLYAQWLTTPIDKTTVTFINGDGSSTNTTGTPGTTLTKPAEKVPTGYHSTGWSPAVPGTFPNDDTTYTLQTAPNTYKVHYDANTGTGTTADSTHTYNVAKALTQNGFTKAADSKNSYVFKGWNTKADGTGTAYSNQQSVTNLTSADGATVTLYAQWEKKATVTFINGDGSSSTVTGTPGTDLTTPTPVVPDGYTGIGWTPSVPGTIPGENTTYTYQTEGNPYTVHYEGNFGTGSGSGTTADSQHVYDVAKNLTANGFTKLADSGHTYTFAGWNTKADGTGTNYANSASVKNLTTEKNGIVTLYAQWTTAAKVGTVIFDPNEGLLDGSTANKTVTGTVGTTTPLPTPVRDGYTFEGWKTDTGIKVTSPFEIPEGTTTLTAQWTQIVEDGEATVQVQKVVAGATGTVTDSFTFKIEAKEASSPMPKNDTVTVAGASIGSWAIGGYDTVGTYDYIITEVAGTNTDKYTYSTQKFLARVFVTNKTGYTGFDTTVRYYPINEDGTVGTKLDDIPQIINIDKSGTSLTLQKRVIGNMGDRSKAFIFTVTFSDGKNYNWIGLNGAANGTMTNGVAEVSLMHGQSVTFVGVPEGVKYSITEDTDYLKSIYLNGEQLEVDDIENQAMIKGSNIVRYDNEKDISIVGANLTSLPFIGMIAVSLAGFVVMFIKKRKDFTATTEA